MLATDHHCFAAVQDLVTLIADADADNTAGLRHCRLDLAGTELECIVSVFCLSELAASQHLEVATTAFAAIASLLCSSTPEESAVTQIILQDCSDALVDVVGSPRGLDALMAAEKLLPHAPGAVAAALAYAVDFPDAAGAMQWWSAFLPQSYVD